MKLLSIVGTRPEGIKMAPVIIEARRRGHEMILCSSGQHRDMLRHGLAPFDLKPDVELDTMVPGQRLDQLTGRLLTALSESLMAIRPDACLVHGDTQTCLAGSLVSFWQRIPCGHVEAGLRSGCLTNPFPEELNRRVADQCVSWHFAPTQEAKRNLLAEGVDPSSITVTGNTAVDAIMLASSLVERQLPEYDGFDPHRLEGYQVVLVTGHRRENHGQNLDRLCRGLRRVLATDTSTCVVFPVHLNPTVKNQVHAQLGGCERTFLIPPQPYLAFVDLMRKASVIVTDSGGIQEEAPSLKKQVLVTRENTERPEVLETGLVRLIGNDEAVLYESVLSALSRNTRSTNMANPVGDGHASERILDHVELQLKHSRRAVA
jgi:UDP-N-acetylglucosamine 2-epimerase (hydrolysing)